MNERESADLNKWIKSLKSIISLSLERLESRWNSWEIDATKITIYEVTGAMVARQISLAKSFSNNPQAWNNDLAPLIMRAMVENIINLKWILKDPLVRSRKFVEWGIGNEKLQVEKRVREIEESGGNPDEDLATESNIAWIDFHRYTFLTEVNLGSWSGKSVRQMSIEAECKDFYDLVYDPFSNNSHSSWNHIGKFNVQISENPLHRFLRTPYVDSGHIDPFYAELSMKYLSMVFDTFESKYFPDINEKSILELFQETIRE
ncbi:DUF5677 domain-containing protein [Flagellimonas flava]|uniref:Uncharacterized protein n=1 Tax=Flagellimonas flava TaxID=570519 RepID=A0A1M5N7F5_9FLAO|nr:DUF5677 domain-containing protein [Allomuricauda flava]SHG85421.1 hypothetical protein SAMN04488116_2698 [Allomuricauda flava]